ncbi:MAG: putative CRISPR-associated protein [Cyanobacteria bacterium P01_F01_bin.33]
MANFILSTIGTSLLTQQISRGNPDEKDWYPKLRDTANFRFEQTPNDVQDIIQTLGTRAEQKLKQGSINVIRSASAELNGIYGLYNQNLGQAKSDMHWLIATDTAQGQKTAEIVEKFLIEQNISCQIYTPPGLSAANTECFSNGIDNLLIWLETITEGYEKVYFNLVGGFKSLQAYLNTIGMFYANEIVYIFEGANSEVIKIPRLPIKIDQDAIAPYALQMLLMAEGAELPVAEVANIPETLLFSVDADSTLSTWGTLIWNKAKHTLLTQDLLSFPNLDYDASFHKDYASTKDAKKRTKLQEVLAKVSYLLTKNSGNIACLKDDGGLLYEVYTNKNGIGHFRVTQGIRVSCTSENGRLYLRRYGTEPEVNRNP